MLYFNPPTRIKKSTHQSRMRSVIVKQCLDTWRSRMVESGHVLVVKVEIYFYNYFTPCLSVCVPLTIIMEYNSSHPSIPLPTQVRPVSWDICKRWMCLHLKLSRIIELSNYCNFKIDPSNPHIMGTIFNYFIFYVILKWKFSLSGFRIFPKFRFSFYNLEMF